MILETIFAGMLHGFGVGIAIGYGLEWRPNYVLPALVILLGVIGIAGIALESITGGGVHVNLAYTLPLMVGSPIGAVLGMTARRVQVQGVDP